MIYLYTKKLDFKFIRSFKRYKHRIIIATLCPIDFFARNKILIIDRELVVTGSFNFTKAAEEKNAENFLIIEDKGLANVYIENREKHKGHVEKGNKTTNLQDRNTVIMPLSEFTIKLIETKLTAYCERRIPMDMRDQVNLIFKISRDNVTLIETRPYYSDPSIWTENPIAQFRFDQKTNKWTLYCMDRFSRWHLYDLIKPSADFDAVLKALDEDKTGIFWG